MSQQSERNNHRQETERKQGKNIQDRDYRFLVLRQVYCWLTKVMGTLVSLNLYLVLTNNSEYFEISKRGCRVTRQHKHRNCNIHLSSAPFLCKVQCAKNNKGNRDKERNDKRKETPVRCHEEPSHVMWSHVEPSFNGQKCYNKQRGGAKVYATDESNSRYGFKNPSS